MKQKTFASKDRWELSRELVAWREDARVDTVIRSGKSWSVRWVHSTLYRFCWLLIKIIQFGYGNMVERSVGRKIIDLDNWDWITRDLLKKLKSYLIAWALAVVSASRLVVLEILVSYWKWKKADFVSLGSEYVWDSWRFFGNLQECPRFKRRSLIKSDWFSCVTTLLSFHQWLKSLSTHPCFFPTAPGEFFASKLRFNDFGVEAVEPSLLWACEFLLSIIVLVSGVVSWVMWWPCIDSSLCGSRSWVILLCLITLRLTRWLKASTLLVLLLLLLGWPVRGGNGGGLLSLGNRTGASFACLNCEWLNSIGFFFLARGGKGGGWWLKLWALGTFTWGEMGNGIGPLDSFNSGAWRGDDGL